MNKERVQLFVDALRSGEYKQVTGGYKKVDGFCGIGVAIDVYRKNVAPLRPFDVNYDYEPSLRWYGIDHLKYYQVYLANDCRNDTFPQIADMVEG